MAISYYCRGSFVKPQEYSDVCDYANHLDFTLMDVQGF